MREEGIQYPIIIYPCPEGGYVAEIPALPGCLAQGETLEECIAELKIVSDLWVETAKGKNRPIPSIDAAVERMRGWSLAG